MKFITALAVLLYISLYSPPSSAWEACMPFCDLECSGTAMTNLATQVVSDISTINSTCSDLVNKRITTAEVITEAFASMTEEDASYFQNILSAIDAAVLKISLVNTAQAESAANLIDVLNSALWQASVGQIKLSRFLHNRKLYGDYAISYQANLMQDVCGDCEQEPLYEAHDMLSEKYETKSSIIAVIEDGMLNRTDWEAERESIVDDQESKSERLAQFNTGWDSQLELSKFLAYQNIGRFGTDTQGEALTNIFATYMSELIYNGAARDNGDYTELSAYSTIKSGSLESLIKGSSLDELLSDALQNDTASLNEHGLSHKLLVSKQVETYQIISLLQHSSIENLVLALEIANEEFN
jgi:hypothetical protein